MRLAVFGILLIVNLIAPSVNSKKKGPSTQFEIDILEAHNNYRATHGVAPLEWSPKLAKLAQEWAERLGKTDKMMHRTKNKYGENIYYAWNMKVDNKQPVVSWYDEIKIYDFENNDRQPKTEHFTQVVWKDTKSMGAGIAKVGKKVWVVANYDPPGNYLGEYIENVLPPQK